MRSERRGDQVGDINNVRAPFRHHDVEYDAHHRTQWNNLPPSIQPEPSIAILWFALEHGLILKLFTAVLDV